MSDPTTNALNALLRRIGMLASVGRVTFGSDANPVQLLQVRFSDADGSDEVPRVAEYGFTSMPKIGCHAVFICVAGDQSNGVVVGTNDPNHRMKNLQPGEVAIYDDQGQSVYLTRAGIVIEGAGLPITVNGATTVNGDTTINGNLHVTGAVTGDTTITAPNVVGTIDVTFGGVSGKTHHHGNVTHGTDTTDGPTS